MIDIFLPNSCDKSFIRFFFAGPNLVSTLLERYKLCILVLLPTDPSSALISRIGRSRPLVSTHVRNLFKNQFYHLKIPDAELEKKHKEAKLETNMC